MRKLMTLCRIIRILLSLSLFISTIGLVTAYAADFPEVEKILEVRGQMEEGAFVARFPRSDIKVMIDGEPVPTSLGFGSSTAWKDMGKDSMVMGDVMLLEKEVTPVISTLADSNINVTALHNHFLRENPRSMYMHICGMSSAPALARGIRKALGKTATPKPHPPTATPSQPALALDTKRIEQIIGHQGQAGGGAFKITLGRPGVKMGGTELTASMGLNIWAAFVGINQRAHVAGDVAMTAPEVNP